jgi:hypothetical protein
MDSAINHFLTVTVALVVGGEVTLEVTGVVFLPGDLVAVVVVFLVVSTFLTVGADAFLTTVA